MNFNIDNIILQLNSSTSVYYLRSLRTMIANFVAYRTYSSYGNFVPTLGVATLQSVFSHVETYENTQRTSKLMLILVMTKIKH